MLASHFIELGIAYLLAAMMPGPSIALIIRNGIVHSRMASVKAALGVSACNHKHKFQQSRTVFG